MPGACATGCNRSRKMTGPVAGVLLRQPACDPDARDARCGSVVPQSHSAMATEQDWPVAYGSQPRHEIVLITSIICRLPDKSAPTADFEPAARLEQVTKEQASKCRTAIIARQRCDNPRPKANSTTDGISGKGSCLRRSRAYRRFDASIDRSHAPLAFVQQSHHT
jgi:hypothetical protein